MMLLDASALVPGERAGVQQGEAHEISRFQAEAVSPPPPRRSRRVQKGEPQLWERLGPWPGAAGVLAAFGKTVEALLVTEQDEAEVSPELKSESRRLRRQILELGKAADELEAAVGREISESLRSEDSCPWHSEYLPVAVPVTAPELLELCEPGVLGTSLELTCNVGNELGKGWLLLGGLALSHVTASVLPIAPDSMQSILDCLRELAKMATGSVRGHAGLDNVASVRTQKIAFGIPMLATVGRQLRLLQGWRDRQARAEQQAALDLKLKARGHLFQSTCREKLRLAREGFSAADATLAHCSELPLQPARFERRIPWSEYRSAARMAATCKRHAERGLQLRRPTRSSSVQQVAAGKPHCNVLDQAAFRTRPVRPSSAKLPLEPCPVVFACVVAEGRDRVTTDADTKAHGEARAEVDTNEALRRLRRF
eukprot:TRINITY_DN67303_c0_g1_i1.p1 TRINITY_DN67303_c0_g1~~TRINITY_DN67303_c0_g1_i1.p1  ORF type:complete len:427 (-),score=86.53 TRINITY_DN67303_c0_g1_i1:53-1333(-)